MILNKKGLIYCSDGAFYWNKTHAQVPVVDTINDERWRIYYSSRDGLNRSRTSFIEVEAGNPKNILYIHDRPILDLGEPGLFDHCGIMPSCIVSSKGQKFLYYIGWNLDGSVPYHNAIGLAVSAKDGQRFTKISNGPIIDRSIIDPYFTGTAFVLFEKEIWKLWYLSCTKWQKINGRYEPFYHLKYAESIDGISWKREGKIAVDFLYENEAGICGASVIKELELYKMWYSYRFLDNYRTKPESSYRIGYAESYDGISWQRCDKKIQFSVDESNWDSIMQAYPYVIKWREKKYIFYNGNGFGKSGFGYAIIEE